MFVKVFMNTVVVVLFVFSTVVARAENISLDRHGVQMAVDLKRSALQIDQASVPIMLFFAAEDCVYCERLEADYLHAMANNLDYQKRVLIRKVVIDSYDEFIDFKGVNVEAFDFSSTYDIQVTPTLVFVDAKGERVSRRIIGYNDTGFFGAELDDVIAFATNRIKSQRNVTR